MAAERHPMVQFTTQRHNRLSVLCILTTIAYVKGWPARQKRRLNIALNPAIPKPNRR